MPAPVVPALINMNICNNLRVQWCGHFLAVNSVKQKGFLSPVLFCLYSHGLLMTPSQAGVGFYFDGNFGAAYADDTVILAPSASALPTTLGICDNYANDYSNTLNGSKTKCIVALYSNRRFLHD